MVNKGGCLFKECSLIRASAPSPEDKGNFDLWGPGVPHLPGFVSARACVNLQNALLCGINHML